MRIPLAVRLGLMGVPVFAQIGAAEGYALAPFGWLRELAGDCGRGQQRDGKASDTRCYEMQCGRFLRGTISMSSTVPDKPEVELRGDSVWAWDAARKRLTLTTWASNGTITSG